MSKTQIKSKTQLKKIVIEKFRALNKVTIEFGEHITVVCGKNGTSKSSILGIAAQIFSFEKDYVKNEKIDFQQITGGMFKSQYQDHFRISNKFDTPGSMKVDIELQDGYTKQPATATLQLDKRGNSSRPVVRKNSTTGIRNSSRNFTHPVIFLSLKRLYPIANRKYEVSDFDYLQTHKQQFIALTNELLNRSSSDATGTEGTISSAVAHGANYDQDSVSAGEDNAGQIILALMSFKKLQEEYPDYKGGMLLIDEADAGLFPTAQENLLRMLDRECNKMNLQVIMTSHSPVLIEYAFQQSQRFRNKFKTVYLSNTYGTVQVIQDWSWEQISADISTKTVALTKDVDLPVINVYFEDKEGADFFAALMNRQAIKKFTKSLSEISFGCSNYINLIQQKIPEFSERSIICLDADVVQNDAQNNKVKNYKTIVILPGELPPDQLIFEYLFNLPADHEFWKNNLRFTREVFTRSAADVIREFSINGNHVDLKTQIESYSGDKKKREIFKKFYTKDTAFRKLLTIRTKSHNPWMHWVKNNPKAHNEFLDKFQTAIRNVMKNGYAVDATKLEALKIKLKKV